MRAKTAVIALTCCAALLCCSCRDVQPKQPEEKKSGITPLPPPPGAAADSSGVPVTPPPRALNCDSLLPVVAGLEGRFIASPGDRAAVAPFLAAAYDTACGSFFVVGRGLPDRKAPQPAWNAGRQRAADVDAQRWAVYAKAWHTGDTRPLSSPIAGEVSYSTLCAQGVQGDTLYRMYQVPVGSVVVR